MPFFRAKTALAITDMGMKSKDEEASVSLCAARSPA